MILLSDVLQPDQILAVRRGLETVTFRAGRATAGKAAQQVKNNDQARGDDPAVIALARLVRPALEAHPVMRQLARPARWSNLIFSRYGPG